MWSLKKAKEKLLVIYKNNDVTNELRSEIIAKSASEYSSKKEVRDALFNIQRNFYDGDGLSGRWSRYGNGCI